MKKTPALLRSVALSALTIIVILLFFGCAKSPATGSGDIRTNKNKLSYYLDDERHSSWTVNPALHPDQLFVECGNEPIDVRFVSEIDSNRFRISSGDTVTFNVIHNADTALTQVIGVPFTINFSDNFIRKYNGTYTVEIPEVFELVNIVFALTEKGGTDDNMIYKGGGYYTTVSEAFSEYRHHPLIDSLNVYLTGGRGIPSYGFYYNMRTNAYAYRFQGDSIVNAGIYRKVDWRPVNYLQRFLPLLQDFALKSGYRKFFRDNSDFYQTLIMTYREICPLKDMWNWLEARSEERYNQYAIVFSPLIGGAHNTQRFSDNGFRQVIMFVSTPHQEKEGSFSRRQARSIRIVFTEIDHNYINPVTADYTIGDYLTRLGLWNTGGKGYYDSPELTFNEYMTWALCFPYLQNKLGSNDFERVKQETEYMMIKKRGFARFGEFNDFFLKLFHQHPQHTPIHALYPEVLEWFRHYENK